MLATALLSMALVGCTDSEESEAKGKKADEVDATPSHTEVCEHTWNLMGGELPDDAPKSDFEIRKKVVQDCLDGMEGKEEELGTAEFNESLRCAMAANSMKVLITECHKGSTAP